MDLMTAAQNVAEDYKGGARQLAADIDKNSTTFSHELNETGGAKLGLRTALKMSMRTRDLRILHAFCGQLGQMCIPLPESLNLQGQDCMVKLSECAKEFADVCQELTLDLSDDTINDNEMARIEREGGQLIAAVHTLMEAARAKNAQTKTPRENEAGRPALRSAA